MMLLDDVGESFFPVDPAAGFRAAPEVSLGLVALEAGPPISRSLLPCGSHADESPALRKSNSDPSGADVRTCSKVQAAGSLSGRQRRNFVPCRKRLPLKWSNLTSQTRDGLSGCHSIDR